MTSLQSKLLVVVLMAWSAMQASASPVTFFFTGHVTADAINGCGTLVDCGVVTGSYTFDSATPDLNPGDPKTGLYAATNISFAIDGVPFFSSTNGVINIANFALVDQYGLLAPGAATNLSQAVLSILLSDPTALAFNSDALPQIPGALASLLPGTFQLNASDSTFQLMGSIDNVAALAPGMGFIQLCKVAATGIGVGTPFTFNVGGTPVIVPAGPSPGGTCSPLLSRAAGVTGVTETVPSGDVVTAIVGSPAASLLSINPALGSATAMVNAGGLTIVTFTDALLADTATVQVCKAAGSGISLGTPFVFTVGGTPVTIPAGTCGPAVLEPAGTVIIAETPVSGVALTGVTAVPAGSLLTSNLAAGSASVTATIGTTTVVTFTDSLAGSPAPLNLDTFQVRYAAHLDMGDSYVNLSNAGTLSGFDPAGRICVNVYTFDPAEEMISCCACPVTPNGLTSLSVRNDLISNTLTPGVPTAVVIKLLATSPVAGVCNASTPVVNPTTLVRGMRAWGTTLHALPSSPVRYGTTETPFSHAELSPSEMTKLATFCQFIQANGSGFGICKSCRAGGLGAVNQ